MREEKQVFSFKGSKFLGLILKVRIFLWIILILYLCTFGLSFLLTYQVIFENKNENLRFIKASFSSMHGGEGNYFLPISAHFGIVIRS